GLAGTSLRAEIGTPGVIPRASSSRQRLAVGVSTGEPPEIAALACADAGHEKRHSSGRSRNTASAAAGNRAGLPSLAARLRLPPLLGGHQCNGDKRKRHKR